MSKGFPFAFFSGALWGLLLVVPEWLNDFSVADITFGRFLMFGGMVLLILVYRRDSLRHLKAGDIQRYLMLSLFGNVLFYLALAGSIRYIGVVPACILVGALPTIGWSGTDTNWKVRKSSVPALVMMVVALLMVLSARNGNYAYEQEGGWVPGVMLLLVAGGCWLISGRVQAGLARNGHHLDYSDHFILSGIVVIPALLVLLPLIFVDDPDFGLWQGEMSGVRGQYFWLLMFVVALMSTVLARLFWRHSARRASPAQLHWYGMWKSLFGLTYAYLLENRLPEGMELAALICFAIGLIVYGRQKSDDQSL